ncbi:MAG: hypothetical protein RJS98_09620 [Rhodospirillaceae bacterium]
MLPHLRGNVDKMLDRLQSEIGEINLPFTAANGSILMMIYEEQSNFRAINRSVLIEQFVDVTLRKGAVEQSQREIFDYTNKTALLAHVAEWMAMEDNYVPEIETVRTVMKSYIDNLGLKVDLTALLNEFFSRRIFIRKAESRLSFRYRAMLEYFIALQMVNSEHFREWVCDETRYLQYINEIQYYAGKLRKDEKLIKLIEARFLQLVMQAEDDLGKIDLQRITDLKLPRKGGSTSSVEHLSQQLSDGPLSQEEKDAELEAELPRDVEERQEVFRPKIDNPGQEFLVALLLYSGIVKNMELLGDIDKRSHLNNIWLGWSMFLHISLMIVPKLAQHRKLRINGVLYEISAPKSISDEELTRMISLNLPGGISDLLTASLGTEKLDRQLTEPLLNEDKAPLVYEYFRTSLISELQLPATATTIKVALERLSKSEYLSESMIWRIHKLRRLGKFEEEQFSAIAPSVATAIANLQGGSAKDRRDQKRTQLEKLNKQGVRLKLQKSLEDKAT